MTATHQLLLGSLAVIALMGLFLVSQYAGKPSLGALRPDDPGARRVEVLQAAGVPARVNAGKVMVPDSYRTQALAILGESGRLPEDTATLFENLPEKQDWKNSRQQNEQIATIALQNELSRIISKFRGVKSASVIIDAPEPTGLGRVTRVPTASATVFTDSGGSVSQDTVDAVANLIAGARAGLDPSNVRVIDGSTGRQRKPTSEDDVLPTTYLEQAAFVEASTQQKLAGLLAYVPGVVVAVTAQVDVTRVNSQETKILNKGEGTVSLPKSETTDSETSSQKTRSGEPGVRSNQTADIASGSSANGTSFQKSNESSDFENKFGTRTESVMDPRGAPTYLAASVSVPMGYIRELVRQSKANADPSADPASISVSEQEVTDRFTQERQAIEQQIAPHLKTKSPDGTMIDGDVSVSMIPVALEPAPSPPAQAGIMSVFGFGSGDGGSGMAETVVVGVLALAALGLMVMMVRKTTRPAELPSPEELVGIPPSLGGDADIVGEADESDAPLSGIELGDDQIKHKKLLEQVGQMVKKDPESAAKLIGRWVEVTE
ncbi:MAG: flagellar M-ring protein FliF C-terminal domain-containing protein [Phycisphaerales bacterium]